MTPLITSLPSVAATSGGPAPASPALERQHRLTQLRSTLAGKFPQAHPAPSPPSSTAGSATSPPAPAFSITLPSSALLSLAHGSLTEAHGSIGCGTLLLESALASAAEHRTLLALVDGAASFDPALPPSRLSRLLWVLCRHAAMALKATDLLLRDGNLPLVILDLQLCPAAELRRIPSTTWYRFQRILEASSTALLVLTPTPLVSSASTRLRLDAHWSLSAMRQHRHTLAPQITPQPRRRTPAFLPSLRSA